MRKSRVTLLLALGAVCFNGCCFKSLARKPACEPCYQVSAAPTCGPMQLDPGIPCVEERCIEHPPVPTSPLAIDESSLSPESTYQLSLDQCIQYALSNSRVFRDLGGVVLRTPEAANSTYDPAITFSDARFGEEAALSEFDANLFASSFFENNDRQLNNQFFGNQGNFQQDLHTYQWGLSKRSATGGQFAFRHITTYDSNNQVSNRVGRSSFETYLESEFRHPLMQGAGSEFNRIAGPNAQPGAINGVLIARVRTDITLAEFEQSVRDLVADVENSYWDLYYAYRDLEAKILARDIARRTADNYANQGEERSADEKAQAEEQALRFQADVVDALNGRPLENTRTNNGSSGGTFRGQGGLRYAERRLRLVMGMPINDGLLVRPTDTPSKTLISYDWEIALQQAMNERIELRRQRWVIKQRELELLANRNFLMPQLDLVGRHRVRGFGEHLLSQGNNNAFDTLYSGDFQELQMGLEYTLPVGFRRAHAAVRNSQLSLAREREVLKEQERLIQFGLSNAFNEVRRAYESMDLQEKRLKATIDQINALETRQKEDGVALDVLLEAHRRLVDVRLRYHQSQIEYALALRNIHFEKGTLLNYCNIALTESASERGAYQDANALESRRGVPFEPAHRDRTVSFGPAM